MLFFKKQKESAQCRYCVNVSFTDGVFICKKKGTVSPGACCGKYKFDPFAKRVPIKRNIDTSVFDPLDFEI